MRVLLFICLGVYLCGLLAPAITHSDQKTDAAFTQDGNKPTKQDVHGMQTEPNKARSRRRRDSQIPSNFDVPHQYTPYYTGQCFMCPPGPRGPPGFDGRDGRDGRDQTLSSTSSDCSPVTETAPGAGKTYIRWGMTTCPRGSHLVYEGFMGGKRYTEKGSGTNYLCLHNHPVFDNATSSRDGGALIYGTEAERTFSYDNPSLIRETELPCAVCMATAKYDVLMIPGVNHCPTEQGWREEYHGIMASMHKNYFATEFICLDREAEGIPGTGHDDDPSLLYLAEAACSDGGGGLPCPPYVDGYEVTCAVCSI